jgi:hypothetical protein
MASSGSIPRRLTGLRLLRSLRPLRTASGAAVPRQARLLMLESRTYFRLRNGAFTDEAGESVDTLTAFRLAELENTLRSEAPARLPMRRSAGVRLASWAARESWIGLLLASLAGYAALGFYLLIFLPGHLLGLW